MKLGVIQDDVLSILRFTQQLQTRLCLIGRLSKGESRLTPLTPSISLARY